MMPLFFNLLRRVGLLCLLLASFMLVSVRGQAQSCQSNNFAANKPVVTSDNPDVAANIVDGNLLTDWYGGADSKWIYVDLGVSQNLCRVTLKWGMWATINETVVQASNDASNWTNLYTIPANPAVTHVPNSNSDYNYDYLDVDVSATTTSYRYVRLYYASGTQWGPHLKEFEVYVKGERSPTVNITSPDTGSNFIQGNNITVTANASEQGGSISKVEFYQGNTKLAESTTAPYQFTWNNVQSGDYTLVAKAYDANNQSAASSAVEIWVDDPLSEWSLNGNTAVTANSYIGTPAGNTNPLIFKTNGLERLRILSDGRVGIKTAVFPNLSTEPDVALAVGGSIYARKLKITQGTWADYVFNNSYRLRPLAEVENYINKHHHLPDVPSANSVASQGVDVGNSQALLLQKIEELTLYVIEQNKKIERLERLAKENERLKKELKRKIK